MKNLRKVALLMVSVLALGLFAGCGGSFDASAYVKAVLDNSYKGDSSGFVDQKVTTADEAAELYDQGIEAELQALIAGQSLTDETKNGYRDFLKELLGKANYTVGEATKDGDSYVVTVTYKQMKIFEPAMTEYMEQLVIQAEDLAAAEDMYDAIYKLLLDCLQDTLTSVEYGEEQTTTITVELINKVYAPRESDLATFETLLFDMDAMG